MSGAEESPEQRQFPKNWDILHDSDPADEVVDQPVPVLGSPRVPPTINVLAASWADAVAVLGVCTAALVGLTGLGHHGSLTALPWAAGLGVVWWTAAAACLVVIRQGTPGMLLAGLVFADRVPPRRLALVIGAAAFSGLLIGLPGIFGARRSVLAIAASSRLESIPAS